MRIGHRAHSLAAVAAALLVAAVTTGCGAQATGGTVDVKALNYELASVIRLDKLAQGFIFDVHVQCDPTDASHLSCQVDALKPGYPDNSWNETVTCRPPRDPADYRCVTDSGYVLQ